MVQRTMCSGSEQVLGAVSGMNHATVQRKIAIEVMNFIGLIHGLMPRIWRVSPIEIKVTTSSMRSIEAPVQNSSASR